MTNESKGKDNFRVLSFVKLKDQNFVFVSLIESKYIKKGRIYVLKNLIINY